MTQQLRLLIVWIAAVVLVGGIGAAVKHRDDPNDTAAGGGGAGGDQQVSVVPGSETTVPPQTSVAPAPTDSTATAPSGPSPGTGVVPAAGSYHTAVSGSATVNGAETYPVPPDGEILVEPTDTGDQRMTVPLSLGVLSWQLRYGEGIDMVSADLMLGPPKTFQPPATVVHVPASPQVGQTWQWPMESTDGATRGTYTTTVSGQSTVDVGGQSVPVMILDSVIEFDPSSHLVGRIQMTTGFSLDRRLPVQMRVVVDVSYGGGVIELVSDVTSTFTSLTPV